MDVFDEAEHPWLAAEKAIIREAVAEHVTERGVNMQAAAWMVTAAA